MKRGNSKRLIAGNWIWVAAFMLLAVSCHSTKITDVWLPEEAHSGTFERLMIVALVPTPGLRAEYEDDFADSLSSKGVLAISSINLVPDVNDIDAKTVEGWLAKYRLDGVVVTRVVSFDRETEYIPPTYALAGWYGAWAVPISPGLEIEHTTIFLETDLFDAKSGKLVYSAVSKTYDPKSREAAVHAVIDSLIRDLTKRGYLPAS